MLAPSDSIYIQNSVLSLLDNFGVILQMQSCKLSIIIPAWNEENRLPGTLRVCIDYLRGKTFSSEILVVTDGSTDRTVEVAESFANEFPHLRVLSFPQKKGKGFGVKQGMLQASGDFRLFIDADNAVPIGQVDEFLDKVKQGYDIVIGSRALNASKIEAQQGFVRHNLALIFGFLQWLVLRLPYKDTQCGFKMFTANAAESFFPLMTYDCAYFDAELIYIAHKAGAKIAELPVIWRHDQETRLPIGLNRSLDLFKKLLAIPCLHKHISRKLQFDYKAKATKV